MELLERASFLESLTSYADEALLGQGRVVLVAGEAGVGKTALLEAFQERMPGASWDWGACDGLSTPRPLALLHDVARELGGALLAAVRAGAPREELFDLVVSMPCCAPRSATCRATAGPGCATGSRVVRRWRAAGCRGRGGGA